MRYKEELEAIAEREAYLRRKYLKPACAILCLALVIIFGTTARMAVTSASASDMAVIKVDNVTKKDIEDAKKKRNETQKKAKSAASKVYELKNKKKQVNYELMALNDANDEQRAQYAEISESLQAALEARVKALDEYITAGENLEKQEKAFQQRVSAMFQFQNKSMFEVLLESNSLAGFFTNMEIMTLIADADAQAVDNMKIALDDAKLQILVVEVARNVERLRGVIERLDRVLWRIACGGDAVCVEYVYRVHGGRCAIGVSPLVTMAKTMRSYKVRAFSEGRRPGQWKGRKRHRSNPRAAD